MNRERLIFDVETYEHRTAGDLCLLAEMLHPQKTELPFSEYSLAHAEILPHGRTVPHKLVKSTEVYWIIAGRGILYMEGEPVELKKGRAVVIPPSSVQYVENNGNEKLEFLCIVSPPWSKSDEVIC